jgi:two-component system cell cycle response regulator DivK
VDKQLVLVVEDNETNMRLVRRVLEFRGFRTMAATTGEEGVALAVAHQPAVVLMDVQLPGMDGVEALSELRSQPGTKHIPVVALTAFALKQDRERLAQAGFDAYLSKPVDVNELSAQVQRFCEARLGT